MKVTIALIAFFISGLTAFAQERVAHWINELDRMIPLKQQYIDAKWKRIDSLKSLMQKEHKQHTSFRYTTYCLLFEEYKSFVYDSAFNCAQELLKTAYLLKDPLKINEAKVKLSFTLLSAGMFKEAIDTLNTIDSSSLSTQNKIEYCAIQARTYFDLSDYSQDHHYSEIYNNKGKPYLYKALQFCDPKSGKYLFLKGWEYMRFQNKAGAIQTFEHLLRDYPLSEHEYAIATSSLSFMYRMNNQNEKAKEYLAKAAIADIKGAVCETVAMRDLAEVLFKEGDINRSHEYVKIALEDSYFYGAKYRKIQIADILPLIESTQLEIVKGQRKTLLYYALALTMLSLLVIGFALLTYRQYKRLQRAEKQLSTSHQNLVEANDKLQEANKIKEVYIGHFYKTLSEYLDKLEKFKMGVDRKISQKKTEEIRDIINSMNLKNEREQLYDNFDTVFLTIFPGFIEEFNSLLKKEEQFTFEKNNTLPPELRIFALIRLGINDTEKIAKILSYSVNTIYTYKTRVKNKSVILNEQFEERIMEIKSI